MQKITAIFHFDSKSWEAEFCTISNFSQIYHNLLESGAEPGSSVSITREFGLSKCEIASLASVDHLILQLFILAQSRQNAILQFSTGRQAIFTYFSEELIWNLGKEAQNAKRSTDDRWPSLFRSRLETFFKWLRYPMSGKTVFSPHWILKSFTD